MKMNNKKNNKGFSLVELIVVVAIMAVLVGVLAPAYLRYVEKSRVQKDISAVSEVVNAIKVASADENVNDQLASKVTLKIENGKAPYISGGTTAIEKELSATIGTMKITSDALTASGVSITIEVSKDTTTNNLIINVKPDTITELNALDENVKPAS